MQYTIQVDEKKVTLPTSWNELSKKEYLYCCTIFSELIKLEKEERTPDFAKQYYAAKILMINKLAKISFRQSLKVTAAQYADLLPVVDFLDKKVNIDQNHLPKICVFGRLFYGPESGLKYSSFLEFISADSYFINLSKSKDPLTIYKLIACLYRPKQKQIRKKIKDGTFNGDMRQAFNVKMINRRANWFAKHMNQTTAQAILYFYWGFRELHVLRFKNLFDKPETDGDVKMVGNNYGWAGTLLEISGDKFGNVDQTGESNWLDVFIELSRQMDKSKYGGS